MRGDVRDRSVFEPLVLRSQAVVHFGAAVSVGQSMYQVDRYVDVNTRGTALLLELPNRAAADRFWSEEPFASNGGYQRDVRIIRWVFGD